MYNVVLFAVHVNGTGAKKNKKFKPDSVMGHNCKKVCRYIAMWSNELLRPDS